VFGFLSSAVLCICLLQGLGSNAHKQASVLRAQIAADAAALAAVSHGDEAARYFADTNGGDIVSMRRFGIDDEYVKVIVSVGGMRAIAVATDNW
jgi:nitrous oxide reductase accessory protein NosL